MKIKYLLKDILIVIASVITATILATGYILLLYVFINIIKEAI